MFRLKFNSLTNNRKRRSQRPQNRIEAGCDGIENGTAVSTSEKSRDNEPQISRWLPRRKQITSTDSTITTPVLDGITMVGSGVACQDQLFGFRYIPQMEAVSPVSSDEVKVMQPIGYSRPVEIIRQEEYPHMSRGTYLDHSGTTIYAKSTIEAFSHKMLTNLYGNPHSANEPANTSGEAVDAVREQALRFFGADLEHFDLVFVANATAGIKLVAEAFRDMAEKTRSGTFWYGYHKEAHTSLVGVREYTGGDHHCFEHDADMTSLLEDPAGAGFVNRRNLAGLGLLAYPGQSNLNGRRLPTTWVKKLRESQALQNTYSLFDAAALAMTSPLDHLFADPSSAPDFTVLSFYKIFGFPDLGGLIVRKSSGHILALRKYFGGGTVSMVSTFGPGRSWHRSKALDGDASHSIHDGVEDGTLPFHSIIALGEAMKVHKRLYGERCMENISRHTTGLVRVLYEEMKRLRHRNGQQVVHVYCGDAHGDEVFGDATRQGATVAFNVLRQDGTWVPYSTVESMANERGIYVRSGGICCPGGLFSALGYEQWELDRARSAGHYCGSDGDTTVIHQLPTGVVRVSIGAMTTMREVQTFLTFLREVFVERDACWVSITSKDSAIAVGARHARADSGYAEGGQAMSRLG